MSRDTCTNYVREIISIYVHIISDYVHTTTISVYVISNYVHITTICVYVISNYVHINAFDASKQTHASVFPLTASLSFPPPSLSVTLFLSFPLPLCLCFCLSLYPILPLSPFILLSLPLSLFYFSFFSLLIGFNVYSNLLRLSRDGGKWGRWVPMFYHLLATLSRPN